MTRIREITIQSTQTSNTSSDKDIEFAQKSLGKLADKFSQSELREIASEIRFLVDTWMDDFEKKMFSGKTLKEVLNDTG